jgi:hypothetical protein
MSIIYVEVDGKRFALDGFDMKTFQHMTGARLVSANPESLELVGKESVTCSNCNYTWLTRQMGAKRLLCPRCQVHFPRPPKEKVESQDGKA